MSIGNLQKILLHNIHDLFCGLILKHESTSPEFVWGSQCSLLGSKIHYLGQEKSNSLHGSTQVVDIHYLGQIHNLGQNTTFHLTISKRGERATGKIQRNNYHHGSCGPSLTGKTMSVFLIFTQGTHRNVKNR